MGRLWQHKDFMRLWTSQTIEAFGGEVTNLALPTVAILLLNAGALEMGILNGLQTLAVPVLGLFVGVWADRWRRRPIMVLANFGRMLVLAWIPLAFIFGVLGLYQLFIVAALLGVFTVFFDIANQSYLPSLIDREDLIEGNSKLQTTQSGAQVIGPALAGFLIQLVGAAESIAVDACGFFLSALMIFSIRKPEASLYSDVEHDFARELKEGARVVFSSPILRSIAACTATLNLGSGIFFAVFLLFTYNQLNLSPEIVGVVLGLGSVGFLVGALTASRIAKALGLGPTLALSIVISGIGLLMIPLVLYGPTVPLLAALWMLSSVGIPIFNINQVSLRQAITPDRLQGRMNATIRTIVRGTVPLGSFVGGILGAQFGIHSTLIIGAVVSTAGVIFLFNRPVRTLRQIPSMT
jgi:MFS family permease